MNLLLYYYWYYYCYYYYYYHFTALWILSRTTQVSQYQKGKTKINLDFLEQETVVAAVTSSRHMAHYRKIENM